MYYDKTDDWYPTIIALLNEYRSANPNISVKTVDYLRDAGEAAENQGAIQVEFGARTRTW